MFFFNMFDTRDIFTQYYTQVNILSSVIAKTESSLCLPQLSATS